MTPKGSTYILGYKAQYHISNQIKYGFLERIYNVSNAQEYSANNYEN